MTKRLVVLLLVAAVVAALVAFRAPEVRSTVNARSADPALVATRGALASTWFCPLGSVATTGTPEWRLTISNSSASAKSARLTVLGAATDAARELAPIELPARSVSVQSAADLGLTEPSGVIVEVDGGEVAVEQRLSGGTGADAAPCSNEPAAQAFFPSLNTQRGNSARIWLMNPFPADASVDMEVASTDGVRVPNGLRGLVVPARAVRAVEMGDVIQRSDQFAVAVRVRSGLLVAGLAQGADGTQVPAGIRVELGRPRTESSIAFADGGAPDGLAERVVVYNPGSVDGRASLNVVPVDGGLAPEAFVLDLPARRFVVVDLDAESRVDRTVAHWLTVESLTEQGVIATRLATVPASAPTVTGDPGRAGSTGLAASATRWFVPYVAPATDASTVLSIANPDPSSIAVVTLRMVAGGSVTELPGSPRIEVPPLQVVTIDAGAAATGGPISVDVRSSRPVLVERRTVGLTRDFTVQPALAVEGTTSATQGRYVAGAGAGE